MEERADGERGLGKLLKHPIKAIQLTVKIYRTFFGSNCGYYNPLTRKMRPGKLNPNLGKPVPYNYEEGGE